MDSSRVRTVSHRMAKGPTGSTSVRVPALLAKAALTVKLVVENAMVHCLAWLLQGRGRPGGSEWFGRRLDLATKIWAVVSVLPIVNSANWTPSCWEALVSES